MIEHYLEGDLVTMIQNSIDNKHGEIQVAHGCNCQKTMGAGIAGALRKFPEIYEADLNFIFPELGKMSTATIQTEHTFPETAVTVFNIYSQLGFGKRKRQANYAAIAHAFWTLNGEVAGTLYIPRIGAGLAGGDWAIIEQIINDATPDLDIIVIDYVEGRDPRDPIHI